MCLQTTSIKGLSQWNWEGDHIVHECIVPSSRPVVCYPGKKCYDIDVREFLVTERNEIMKKTIREDIKKYIQNQQGGDWDFFSSRRPGSFDYRVGIIRTFVSEKIAYERKDVGTPWLFPDETLFIKKGDCEDRAFLIASLLLASGISSYNIRVALGEVRTLYRKNRFDHMWVMYKGEDGRWMLIEPLIVRTGAKKSALASGKTGGSGTMTEYIPSFVFNTDHLWAIKHAQAKGSFPEFVSQAWKKFDPTFAGEAHRTILNAALRGADEGILLKLNGYFQRAVLKLIGPIVDDIDRRTYDPRDHFDNGYIDEGWRQVAHRLANFRADNGKNLDSFALAAHGIADFYAHTSYAHFAKTEGRNSKTYAVPYDPEKPDAGWNSRPVYGAGSSFNLAGDTYTINEEYWPEKHRDRIPGIWAGRIISGRYGQKADSWDDDAVKWVIEATLKIPEDLQKEPNFRQRGSLPHHNEIAVDQREKNAEHILYTTQAAFESQFLLRRNAAILHIRKAFYDNWTAGKLNWTMPPDLSETGI